MSTITANRYQQYHRIYVWEWAVRFYHWINALTIFILMITGFLIGHPMEIFSASEAYQQYWFGYIRAIHFVTAYIFTFNLIFRLYWGFVGNRFAKWSNFIPHTTGQVKEMVDVIRMDILLTDQKSKLTFGHNSLAAFAYFGIMLISLFQIFSGLALFSDMSQMIYHRLIAGVSSIAIGAILWRISNSRGKKPVIGIALFVIASVVLYFIMAPIIQWIVSMFPVIFGSDGMVRQIHHILLWVIAVFVMIHVYLTFYHDYIEGRGTVSSMVGGWKFAKEEPDEIKKMR